MAPRLRVGSEPLRVPAQRQARFRLSPEGLDQFDLSFFVEPMVAGSFDNPFRFHVLVLDKWTAANVDTAGAIRLLNPIPIPEVRTLLRMPGGLASEGADAGRLGLATNHPLESGRAG